MIIVIANQKGGVGKSTLCLLFANYLSSLDKKVLVVDADPQKTISNIRKNDVDNFEGQEPSYPVEEFKLADIDSSLKFIQIVKANKEFDVVIIDTPGDLTKDGLIPFLTYSDFILCPFIYDPLSLESTNKFMFVIRKLNKEIYNKDVPKIIFIPNRIDIRIGTAQEKENNKDVDNVFRGIGKVAPLIPSKKILRGITSLENSNKQSEDIKGCFEYLINVINV